MTPAATAFQKNFDRMGDVVALVASLFDPLVAQATLNPIGPARDALERDLKRLVTSVYLLNEWYVVMQVTFAEAYLQDVLVHWASEDPSAMRDSDQKATYAQVTTAESLDSVASEMRRRWARNFIDDGGPRKWLRKLRCMGARGYTDDLVDVLEEAWGVRHVVVHNAGIATTDFVTRHESFGVKVGESVVVHKDKILDYVEQIGEFVKATDAFFEARITP